MFPLRKIADILEVLNHKNGGLKYLRKEDASITSFLIFDKLRYLIPRLDSLVDVGGNQGQFARAAKRYYPEISVYSFEPVPETFAKLEKNFSADTNVKLYNFGLGSSDGEITFYKNNHSHASSVLPISEIQKREIPETAQTTVIKIPIKRLDHLCESEISVSGTSMLKLDVQGYEKEVLEGCTTCLSQFDYLLFETSFVPMYEGEPLFEEMNSYVSSRGFEIVGPVGLLLGANKQIMQMDMLYKNAKKVAAV